MADWDQLVPFIARDDLDALEFDDLLTRSADSLSLFPFKGRVGRDDNSRELVIHKHYILVYGID